MLQFQIKEENRFKMKSKKIGKGNKRKVIKIHLCGKIVKMLIKDKEA